MRSLPAPRPVETELAKLCPRRVRGSVGSVGSVGSGECGETRKRRENFQQSFPLFPLLPTLSPHLPHLPHSPHLPPFPHSPHSPNPSREGNKRNLPPITLPGGVGVGLLQIIFQERIVPASGQAGRPSYELGNLLLLCSHAQCPMPNAQCPIPNSPN